MHRKPDIVTPYGIPLHRAAPATSPATAPHSGDTD